MHQGEHGGDPAVAGGHCRYREDPVRSSTDPAHVNPEHEVWLGFTVDAHGAGAATARQSGEFRPGAARSVVVHGMPGGAGARIACFTVLFEPAAFGRAPVESMPVGRVPAGSVRGKSLVHHGS
ncbi:hypothetical protein [Streptomyces sp. NBC_00063]|uniref:hypothetical protein n=1 Tax=Streptomyces sp. NBC_00063 TaxID=2975638 RepID=UPI003D72C52C